MGRGKNVVSVIGRYHHHKPLAYGLGVGSSVSLVWKARGRRVCRTNCCNMGIHIGKCGNIDVSTLVEAVVRQCTQAVCSAWPYIIEQSRTFPSNVLLELCDQSVQHDGTIGPWER